MSHSYRNQIRRAYPVGAPGQLLDLRAGTASNSFERTPRSALAATRRWPAVSAERADNTPPSGLESKPIDDRLRRGEPEPQSCGRSALVPTGIAGCGRPGLESSMGSGRTRHVDILTPEQRRPRRATFRSRNRFAPKRSHRCRLVHQTNNLRQNVHATLAWEDRTGIDRYAAAARRPVPGRPGLLLGPSTDRLDRVPRRRGRRARRSRWSRSPRRRTCQERVETAGAFSP